MVLETIQAEMNKALKSKASERLGILRLLISEIKNEAFKEGKKRTEDEVLLAYHKRLVKAKEEFGEKQPAFGEKLDAEIKVVAEFLPKFLSEEDVRKQLQELAASGTPISLKTVMPLFKGKADSKMLQEIVKNWET
jgi:uncharacterized protein YqeY